MAGEPVAGTTPAAQTGDAGGGFAAVVDTLLAPEAVAAPAQGAAAKADVNPLLLAVDPDEAPAATAAEAPASTEAEAEAAPAPAVRGTQSPIAAIAVKQVPTGGEGPPAPEDDAELPVAAEGKGKTATSPKKPDASRLAEPERADTAAPHDQPLPVATQIAQLQSATTGPAKGTGFSDPQPSAGAPEAASPAQGVRPASEGGGMRGQSPVPGPAVPADAPAVRPFEPATGHATMMAAADAAQPEAAPALPASVGSSSAQAAVHGHEAVTLPAQPGRLGHEMGVEIARRAAAGGDELLIRLDPAEMGRIEVRMSFDDSGGLKAVLAADSPAALDLLRRESADLQRALSDAGVRADPQNLRFDSRAGDGHPGQRQHPAMQRQQEAGAGAYADDGVEQIDYRPVRTSGRVDLMA